MGGSMNLPDCPHRPPCPLTADRARCGYRTQTEQAVARGVISREAGARLLRSYHLPMTPPSKVWKPNTPPTSGGLF